MKPTPQSNRTGVIHHPELLRDMIESTEEFGPTSRGDAESIAQVRIRYAKEGVPHGTMPPAEKVPQEVMPLLDKLGARLQFERTGVRLYEALISKHEAYGGFEGGPSRKDLQEIRDQEHHHAALAQRLIKELGGDPTAMTPCASIQATASRGVMDVLVDPRTSFIESLETILIAELADHESWRDLVAITGAMNRSELQAQVREAENTEDEHLRKVRAWVAAARNAKV